MHHVHSRATAAPHDRERPISVSQELPAWPPPQAPDHAAANTAPLRRVLADMPDEYRLEPLGVIEAELRRNRAGNAHRLAELPAAESQPVPGDAHD